MSRPTAGKAQTITWRQARRLAIASQGLSDPRPLTTPDRRHLRRVFRRTQLVQIDSVNVLQRAHYLPAFSRLGAYPTSVLDAMSNRDHELFEYWGHEAALLPVALHPLMRWRMRRAAEADETWGRMARLAKDKPAYIQQVYDDVAALGPVSAGDIAADQHRGSEHWGWNWTDAKTALEYLFWCGRITAASRVNFERRYDLTERVIPPAILDQPTPDEHSAHRELLMLAAASLGVATFTDLADYFRLNRPRSRPRLTELVDDGRLEQVHVAGWTQPAYLIPGTTLPRRTGHRALLVPFDPLIWERDRTERLFGFRYRIEIYVPAEKRVHGYYVLPFLLGDALVARVDLKADRTTKRLLVQAAFAEPTAPPDTAEQLADELWDMAGWLGFDDVTVMPRGDLSPALAAAMGGH